MITEDMNWKEAQKFEKEWWSTCKNTLWEEVKQMELAPYLGLQIIPNVKGTVVDPCDYPKWVAQRYKEAGVM